MTIATRVREGTRPLGPVFQWGRRTTTDAAQPRHPAGGPPDPFAAVITHSPVMREVIEICRQVAPTQARILLLGETGTGKELLARAIHEASARPGPFVPLNCGAVPEHLVESELFGHERGSFTGADRSRLGLFRRAHGGTLLLDEVGDLPLPAQASTLRALEERAVRPIGGNVEIPVDVRVLAATSKPLDGAVVAGQFRPDLLYRLDVIRIVVPPLRERREDVLLLFDHFLAQVARQHGAVPPETRACFREALLEHPWPGNIRQLYNLAERVLLTAARRGPLRGRDADDLLGPTPQRAPAPSATEPRPSAGGRTNSTTLEVGPSLPLAAHVAQVERVYLERALQQTGGRIQATARLAGMSRRTLLRKLNKYGLQKRDFM